MSVQVTKLPNGLRVATDLMPSVETVSLGIWADAGTRHEEAAVNGVAHLLEHMLFKGTPGRTALRIVEDIESVGGVINAYTTREQTAYYAHVMKEDVALALDVLSDILQHSLFDEGELERERKVVLQEIGLSRDTPDDVIFDFTQSVAFPDQPVGRPILGLPEIVSGLPRTALMDYVRTHYTPENLVLVASGNISHEALVDLAMAKLNDLPEGARPDTAAAVYKGGDYREEKALEQAHVIMGFQGIGRHDPDYFAASVLSTLLGGGMSSRLFQEVREKHGLVYSIYTYAAAYRDTGLFGIYAGTGPDRAGELAPVICGEITRLADSLEETEIARARAQIRAAHLMARESTVNRCEQLAMQMLTFDHPLSTDEILGKIDAVDLAALQRVAKRIFSSPLSLSALGPVANLDSYETIRGRLESA